MKPLELTVYPKRLVDSGFHRIDADGSWIAVRTEEWLIGGAWNRFPPTKDKRLTDAELAAEYWRAKWTGEISQRKHPFMLTEANLEKIKTVERFMTLPHASETNYE